MSVLGDSSPVRLGLAVAACVAVSMISYQQGQIQAATPKEGQYVSSIVFTATMGGVDTKLAAMKDTQDMRMQGVVDELSRLREELVKLRDDVARLGESGNAPASR